MQKIDIEEAIAQIKSDKEMPLEVKIFKIRELRGIKVKNMPWFSKPKIDYEKKIMDEYVWVSKPYKYDIQRKIDRAVDYYKSIGWNITIERLANTFDVSNDRLKQVLEACWYRQRK